MQKEEIYTVKQLCEKLDLVERTVTDLLRSGKLKGYKEAVQVKLKVPLLLAISFLLCKFCGLRQSK